MEKDLRKGNFATMENVTLEEKLEDLETRFECEILKK